MAIFSFIVSTAAMASVYAVLALAVVIVYRSNQVLMFHVGELGVLGAYVAATLLQAGQEREYGLPAALFVALAVSAAAGYGTHLLIDRVAGRLGHFVGTVLTIAMGIILMGGISLLWAGEAMRLPLVPGAWRVGEASIAVNPVVVTALNGVALVLVLVFIRRSSLGLDMRAVANNAKLAGLRRVPVFRVLATAWVLASVLAGLGGIGMASMSTVAMEGAMVGISGIVAALLGGMTNLGGALVGAVLIAAVQNATIVFLEPRYGHAVPIILLLLVLSFRPYGLSSRVEVITRV